MQAAKFISENKYILKLIINLETEVLKKTPIKKK